MIPTWSPGCRESGFTLIEVIGALVIFSMGVLMVLQVSGALGLQMQYAGARSEIAVLANERLDSIEATPFDSIATDTVSDTLTVSGISYQRQVTITVVTPVLFQIDVTFSPAGQPGPSYSATSYRSAIWEES